MSEVWFTADTHFGHGRIIEYCNRPFKSHEEMDEIIIQRFAEVIKPGDRLYHLGDVSWSSFNLNKFFSRINTKEVHLIWGNHDKEKRTVHPYIRSYSYLKSIHIDKASLMLCHYPMRSWASRGRGGFQLYGHVHGKMAGIGRQMDVGVDTNNFYPYNYDEIYKRLKDLPFYEEELDT